MLFVFIYLLLCPARFPYQMMFVSFKIKTWGITCEAGTVYPSGASEFTPVLSGVRVTRFLVFCVMFCRSLFALLNFFFWPLYCRLTASDYPFDISKLYLRMSLVRKTNNTHTETDTNTHTKEGYIISC